jgi:hypothetical protein
MAGGGIKSDGGSGEGAAEKSQGKRWLVEAGTKERRIRRDRAMQRGKQERETVEGRSERR